MGKFELEIKLSAKKELATTPYEGIGNPEPLKYQLNGYW